MKTMYGVDSMPETAEMLASKYFITEDLDSSALRSQRKAIAAQKSGRLAQGIVSVAIPRKKGDPTVVDRDEHLRPDTTLSSLAGLKGIVRPDGTQTAGNASGVNDGAAALLLASEKAVRDFGLTPRARVLGFASAGVAPRVMGIGPVPAVRRLLNRIDISLDDIDVIELNEAFAVQGLAVLRQLGIADDDMRVNPNGGAIALGDPLGMSGARVVATATTQLRNTGGRYAICRMCVGVEQGAAVLLERAE